MKIVSTNKIYQDFRPSTSTSSNHLLIHPPYSSSSYTPHPNPFPSSYLPPPSPLFSSSSSSSSSLTCPPSSSSLLHSFSSYSLPHPPSSLSPYSHLIFSLPPTLLICPFSLPFSFPPPPSSSCPTPTTKGLRSHIVGFHFHYPLLNKNIFN